MEHSQRGLPPLNLPLTVVVAITSLIAKQSISIRERRRLIILLCLKSACQQQVADDLEHVPRTVKRWFLRGKRMLDILTGRQESLSPGQLERLLLETVQDAYRSGSRLTFFYLMENVLPENKQYFHSSCLH
jgi:hypothetical protein